MRLHTCLIVASSTFTFIVAGQVAQAADCKPLQIVNTVKMESVNDGNAFLVPVDVNGTKLKLLLDTGDNLTQITNETASNLGLKTEESPLRIMAPPSPSTDALGIMLTYRATVQTIALGNQHGENVRLQILPEFKKRPLPEFSGVLSTDWFRGIDVDLDFGASRLNYFSPDHCQGQIAYWKERPLAVVPIETKGGHVTIPVTIDGHQMDAVIDTGADRTVMSATTAKYDLNFDLGSADNPVTAVSPDDPRVKTYSHKFATLSFEGVAIQNPKIDIKVDVMGLRTYVDNLRVPKMPALTIGMNVLKHLHVYIAYKEKKLYISPAGTGESVLFKTATAPAN